MRRSYLFFAIFITWCAILSLYEGVDISAATSHGIKVARIPSGETGNAASCAEMAIYLMLGLLRKQVSSLLSNNADSLNSHSISC